MSENKRIVGIVPARGGSKSIPRKNVKLLGGIPLIAYSIEAGLRSKYLDRVIVSTDDPEIAAVAREWGAEVPFMR
ncbi:MAG: acylneuraminate cytidylyltransferase family protein, partial [Saprospiraceae bacterium]|nr:acylneuraminate cytidylyltransferase family protein [Saprospiraceae bacterium]